ncbi:restriction endonuclease subunit S [Niabella terrae]
MRFPGFEGKWELRKLGEVAEIARGKSKHRPRDADFLFGGKYPFIQTGDIKKADLYLTEYNQTYSEQGLKQSKLWNEDTLCITIAANIAETAILKIKACFPDSIIGLIPYKDKTTVLFVKYSFDKFKIFIQKLSQGVAQDNLNQEKLSKIEFNFPSLSEQQKIASFFSLIDQRIATQNKIIEELKLLKITISKKLFLRQLRFKNGNNENYIDWYTKKLGEVTTLINRRNKNNEKFPVYSINNKLGFVPQSEQFEGVDSEDRGYDIKLYKIIDKNTFAYNPARINVGSIGYNENLENIIISSLYVCFKTDNIVNDNFLYQYLKTDFFNREVLKNVEGGVRDYLFYDNFARIKFDLPCIEEQKKIADYLSSIDSKIDIESQLLHKFEEQKRYLLANLFI